MITAHGILQSGSDVIATMAVSTVSLFFNGNAGSQNITVEFTQALTHRVLVTRIDTGDGLTWISFDESDITSSPTTRACSVMSLKSGTRSAQVRFRLQKIDDSSIIDTQYVNITQTAQI
ncbi:MAG: hypothetical protein RBT74_10895 [Tenuifilaceae bacterium]|jgi:hypothetical protein|nr:hypothetical protein [Tenuifilaceae bacterium]